MKKNLLFLLLFLSAGFFLKAQDIESGAALKLVSKNITALKLSASDMNNVIVSGAYHDQSSGFDMVYLQQSYKGLPVYNQIQVLAFKDGLPVSNSGGRIASIEKVSDNAGELPAITAEQAVRKAMEAKNISTTQAIIGYTGGKKLNFGKLGVAHEDITAELMWVPLKDGKKVRLAWQVYLVPVISSDYWMIRVDANNNNVIDENNLTVYCNWGASKTNISTDNLVIDRTNAFKASKSEINNLFDFNKYNKPAEEAVSPSIVNSASYRVIKYPAESPLHPGGAPALVTDPWILAPGNASTLKWHSTGTTDYNITRGNNVWAKEDHAASNSSTGAPATSTTPDPLTFNFAPDFLKQPNQTAPVPNQQFNITNLFYWINTYHDIMYQYGFDEPAGNFQVNNQGRGGAAADQVLGDAQDGNYIAPNQDNANFATPADGASGRMQMYLWDTVSRVIVNTPASIAGIYSSVESAFSTANKLVNIGPVTAPVVRYNDNAAGTTHEGCTPPANSLTGKIVIIDRGNCTFVIKVKNAQNAGAVGVIMVNNVATPALIIMAGDDNSITIPAVCVSQAVGAILAAQAANNENITLGASNLDGDVDNGVIMHEHTHGLSNRLTGGPSQAGCVSNAENMGEGWSDYYSLMMTQDWSTATLSTGVDIPRAIGTYVIGQQPSGTGIRGQLYCTDFLINNLVYAASIDAESHNRGEIWCATLWDMTWDIINQVGTINPNLYNATGGGGNTIAMKLVTEGMKLQPCSPGFIDGRNAILAADQALYNGAHACVIKEAFRRRGMGTNASQGSSNSVTDQVADFAAINCASCTAVAVTTQPAATTACTGTNAVFTVAVDGTTPTYQWQVSTDGGTVYNNIPGATAATLTLTSVTAAMNGNLYHVIISNTCPSTITSAGVLLTVNNPASITAQPTSFAACAGAAANFTVTAAGATNTYQWQVSTDGGITFTNIAGATSNTLSLPAITGTMNGNQYHVVISSCGPTGLISNNVTLTVNTTATISAQPTSTSACTGGGGNAVFTVTASGSSLTYQWQVSTNGGTTFTNIAGATAATLTLTGITSALNNNIYQVLVGNPCTTAFTSSQATLTVSDPAAITTQPAASTVCAGATTSFTIATAGTGVTYQWQESTDGGTTFTNIAGATSATLTLTGVTAAMNGNQYHVQVISCSPTGLSSNNVSLTVNSPVAITTQPTNANACAGSNASITVNASGTGNAYQWQVSTDGGTTFTNIAGATAATLTLTGVTAALNNNVYHVIITNGCTAAGITSANSILTISNAAAITAQPVSTTVCSGTNAVFTATASGSSYQWQVSTDGGVSFTDIAGANTTTLTITAVTAAMNNNQYQLVIGSCGAGSISTDHVTLNVNVAAAVTTSPSNATVCDGANATFTVSAAGSSPAYQWSVSTDAGTTYTAIAGATAATLTITGVSTALNNNLYQVSVTNSCVPAGVNSAAALLTVSAATQITLETLTATACEGNNASFSIETANGTGATYQWQVSTDGGITFTNVPNANAISLTLNAVTVSMNNNIYHVVVTGCGTVTSSPMVLTVNALPVVVITASPYTNLTEGLSTTLTATSTPPATVFSWFKNNVLVPSATSNTINVAYSDTGSYYASVVDPASSCSNVSNTITIADSIVNIAFIYPNPNAGFFYVRFKAYAISGKTWNISMFDAKGARVYTKAYLTPVLHDIMEVHAEGLSKGVYVLVLSDASGTTLGTGKVLIQ